MSDRIHLIEATTPWATSPAHITYGALLTAMTKVAIKDYLSVPVTAEDQKDKADAEAWLFGSGEYNISFSMICDAFHIDVNKAREALRDRREALEDVE